MSTGAASAPAVHHEKDVLLFDVFPEEGVTEKELETAITETKIPSVTWIEGFKKEEVAFGVWKLSAGCVITDAAVTSTDSVTDTIAALHSKVEHHHGGHAGHHGHGGAEHGTAAKKLVRSVEFKAFSKL